MKDSYVRYDVGPALKVTESLSFNFDYPISYLNDFLVKKSLVKDVIKHKDIDADAQKRLIAELSRISVLQVKMLSVVLSRTKETESWHVEYLIRAKPTAKELVTNLTSPSTAAATKYGKHAADFDKKFFPAVEQLIGCIKTFDNEFKKGVKNKKLAKLIDEEGILTKKVVALAEKFLSRTATLADQMK